MLGISLLLVGIVLVHNGVLLMSKVKREKTNDDGTTATELVPLIAASPKSYAFFNAIVGGFLVIGNFVMLGFHAPLDLAGGALPRYMVFNNLAAGFVFGITYLFIAGNLLFKLDMRPFGLFSIGASIFALTMTVYNFYQLGLWGIADGETFLVLGILWLIWFVLWLTGVLQFICKIKAMEKIFPWASIAIGIVGAFVPAIMLLLGVRPFGFL